MTGIHVRFDEAFDGSVWPGPLGDGATATFGEAWVGAQGLIRLLETGAGLDGDHASDSLRAAELIEALRRTEGYWSASFEMDPHGTALRLIRDRDALFMTGWRGQSVSPRLDALAACLQGVIPGVPDRLDALTAAVGRRGSDVSKLELLAPRGELPGSWRALIDALERAGTEITVRPPPDRVATTIELLRPPGPLAAAENVAAWLAHAPPTEGAVIIGGAGYLDRALRTHGLPTTGVSTPTTGLLAVLPLVIELGWAPADPDAVHALIAMPLSPIPRGIGYRLRSALDEWPAVGSDKWTTNLQRGLDRIEDEARRARVADRLQAIFTSVAPHGDRYPVDAVVARTRLVDEWATSRAHFADDATPFHRVRAQCQHMLRLMEAARPEPMVAAELRRWLRIATEDAPTTSAFPREAAADLTLAHVGRPDAVAGPVHTVIWWGFERAAGALPAPVPLTRAELDGLKAHGAEPPDPGTLALRHVQRWWRPLQHARERVILVCPRRADSGDELYPHPLFDELCQPDPLPTITALPTTSTASSLVALPRQPTVVRRPAVMATRRDSESPTSLSALLGCSFRWAVNYFGRLRGGISTPLGSSGPLLYGKLAHRAFERVLAELPDTADAAASRVDAFMQGEARQLAATLYLPGREQERAKLQDQLRDGAVILWNHVRNTGCKVESIEKTMERPFIGGVLRGQADLVLAEPDLVIDHKWGRRKDRNAELREGTAMQLAAYTYQLGRFIPNTYFIISNRALLEANTEPEVTWNAVEEACRRRYQEVDDRTLVIPPDGQREAVIEDGALSMPPPCGYCDYSALCGKAFGS